jgi:hypothetical protein
MGIRFEQARSLTVQDGYTGYKPVPPAIRKNVARGKPLPPGTAKKAAPPALLRQLPQRARLFHTLFQLVMRCCRIGTAQPD